MHTHHEHGRRPLRSIPKLIVGALRHLWASDVNVAAVEILAPKSGDRVVDLGSGFGPATRLLADQVGPSGSVVAIDPTRSLRLVLRARTSVIRQTDVTVSDGTAESMPLPDQSVDAVMSLNAMHHMDDLEQAARELFRVLKPGGKVLLIDEQFGEPEHSMYEPGGHAQHAATEVDPDHVAGLLRQAGFAEVTSGSQAVGGEPALVVTAQR